MTTLLILLFLFCLVAQLHCGQSLAPISSSHLHKNKLGQAIALHSAASAIPAPDESAVSEVSSSTVEAKPWKKEELKLQALKEGGPLTFNTKFGALNPYAIYYGLVSIGLGLIWYAALNAAHFLYLVTGGRIDKRRRLVNFLNQVWGESLMTLVRARPEYVNKDKLKEFFKKKEAAMFVANHNSWLDIPFVGSTIGWRNYKLVSKKELGKVPILGKAIKIGGHIMVDRSNRKSQLMTLRQGMDLLKGGVHLCTFPEGTRSKSGHLLPFKNGAFKMAHKVGAPVIPLSLVGSAKAMPFYWMFPFRPARGIAKVIVHDPISSKDKTEEELAAQVRAKIIEGLPEDQRPLEE